MSTDGTEREGELREGKSNVERDREEGLAFQIARFGVSFSATVAC